MLDFALNQVTMARAPLRRFLETARDLGCNGVELRNDLGRPLFDGLPAREAGDMVRDHGLRLLGLSQVYPCNRWSETVATESQILIDSAVHSGAESISLIPCNDGSRLDASRRHHDLTQCVETLFPMLADAQLTGLIEPLGFGSASLRMKSEAVAVIASCGASQNLKIVHDTFHHHLADDGAIFAANTGIVHISGVSDAGLNPTEMQDRHRVLVDENDQLGNISQINALLNAGYSGAFSFECFAPGIHRIEGPLGALRQSMDFITSHLQQRAA